MSESRSALPMVIGGLLLALVLILIATNGRAGANRELVQQFTSRPPAPGEPTSAPFQLPQVSLPSLPPEVQQVVTQAQNGLQGGQGVPALTPVAQSARARVSVSEVRREGEKLRVRGEVSNAAAGPLTIPPGAFAFRDSAGTNYATSGTGGATLQPGEQTLFDLTVPVPDGLGLTLILTLPPDPPIEQVLVVEIGP